MVGCARRSRKRAEVRFAEPPWNECSDEWQARDQQVSWIGHQKRRQSDGQINVVHSYRCSPQHCRACPRQVACSTNPNRGRAVKRSEHEALVEAHRARMATVEAKSLYRLRGQTVELGFADFKQHRSMRQFSGRGRDRAQRQVGLTVLVHNLLVVHRAKPPPENTVAATLTAEEPRT